MDAPEALVAPLPFWLISIAALAAVVMLWVPYRSGRRPLALFDQFAAYGIAGALGACAAGVRGPWPWLAGLLGLAGGLLAYLLANRLLLHAGPPQRPAGAWAAIAVSSLACGLATGFAFSLCRWLLS